MWGAGVTMNLSLIAREGRAEGQGYELSFDFFRSARPTRSVLGGMR